MKIFLASLAALILVACPQLPPKPPVTDVSDAAVDAPPDVDGASRYPSCTAACSKMKDIGCPEGMTPDSGKSCYTLCSDTQESKKFDLKPACIAAAKSIEDVRACGTLRCQK